MDPVTLAALGIGTAAASAIPSIVQMVRGQPEYLDPTSEEYKRRYGALRTQIEGAPETGTAFAGAEREAFGALGASKAVGEEQARLAEALRAQSEGRAPSLEIGRAHV